MTDITMYLSIITGNVMVSILHSKDTDLWVVLKKEN
jgi:hypothetical protein